MAKYPKKFYMLNVPEVAYHGVVYVDHFDDAAFVARCRTVCQRNTGATLSPFNGFLFLQGIQTWPFAWSGTWKTRAKSPNSCAIIPWSSG